MATLTRLARKRVADRDDLALAGREYAVLARLRTPRHVQSFLDDDVEYNYEVGGETILSVRRVLAERRAHCIEGAFAAACALWVHGKPPLVMYLDCSISDYPHVVALFKTERCWGAISKSREPGLRYRDPVYRSLRELAMSYFHEYRDTRWRRTLRGYSLPFDMRRIDPTLWVTSDGPCQQAQDRLTELRQYSLISRRQELLAEKPYNPYKTIGS